jgi:hypothetical protein
LFPAFKTKDISSGVSTDHLKSLTSSSPENLTYFYTSIPWFPIPPFLYTQADIKKREPTG